MAMTLLTAECPTCLGSKINLCLVNFIHLHFLSAADHQQPHNKLTTILRASNTIRPNVRRQATNPGLSLFFSATLRMHEPHHFLKPSLVI